MSNKKLLLTVMCTALLCITYGNVFAQRTYTSTERKAPLRADSAAPMQITYAGVLNQGTSDDYQGNSLFFSTAQNPFNLLLTVQVNTPVNVKYSLYTFKKTFSQDGKRGYLQGINECNLNTAITTQAQIDANLDKIYEFPAVTENTSTSKFMAWDGNTDPQFTGQKYAVRDCIYVAAYNADTGALIDTQGVLNAALNYQTIGVPAVAYNIDQQKDNSGNITKETLSAKVYVAYPDSWPIKKLTALIMTEDCGFGATPITVVNQGADAIAANINSRLPGDVVAHITLTNPNVAANNPDIKTFDWKDIKTEDGKDFVPDLVKNPQGYLMAIIVDMDDMTFTGVKNGSIAPGVPSVPPVPKSYTGIQSVDANKDVKIYPNGLGGFNIDCPNGICVNNSKYRVINTGGQVVGAGNVNGNKIETGAPLTKGQLYIIQVDTSNGTVTQKVIKN
ncbi:MAG: T9SS type A sorting domain-containing protein [Elusimicrobia bacterium]|nr:T9SS type A sorting domain-containing protein [Elusimicrobiota bacterium]